jgi:hypothetical protein
MTWHGCGAIVWRAMVLAVGIAAAVGAGVVAVAIPAGATRRAPAYVLDGETNRLLSAGGSRTTFALGLPPLARCPGDSTAMPFYRAYTYVVPAQASPTDVNFTTGEPDHWYGLYASGTQVEAINVLKGSGLVAPVLPGNLTLPPLAIAHLLPNGANAAAWDIGVACTTYIGNVVSYWNAQLEVTASVADAGGYTWTVTQRAPSSGGSNLGFSAVGFGLAGLLAAGAVALIVGGRSRRHAKVTDDAADSEAVAVS